MITRRMLRAVQIVLIVLSLAACAEQPSVKSVEVLDMKTGATLGLMPKPLAFIETGRFRSDAEFASYISDLRAGHTPSTPHLRPSVVYLGPVEWDRSGRFTYGLWLELAPGESDSLIYDIRAQGAVNLKLDDGPVALIAAELPRMAGTPYAPQPLAEQTAYFPIDLPTLKRMSVTQSVVLTLRARRREAVEDHERLQPEVSVDFIPEHETHAVLSQYIHERGVADD